MPKVINPTFPLDGLLGILKPSGPTSMYILDRLKPLFRESSLFVPDDVQRQAFVDARKRGKVQRGKNKKFKDPVKMGQGGTLDPLADGVLVIGLNKGTKSLAKLLDSSKEYHTIAMLGCETDTYDSQGSIVRTAPFSHVTREALEKGLGAFRGEISQLPPIYSALKMDGKPLYEYARAGLPLPRPIEPRKCTVEHLELIDWQEARSSLAGSKSSDIGAAPTKAGHRYEWPKKQLPSEEVVAMDGVRKLIETSPTENSAPSVDPAPASESVSPSDPSKSSSTADSALNPEKPVNEDISLSAPSPLPPVFALEMTVSSGTYVRSIVHDLAHAVGSAAHVVSLTRTKQGDFRAGPSYVSKRLSSDSNSKEAATAAVQPGENEKGKEVEAQADDVAGDCIPWDVFENAIKLREDNPEYEAPEGTREEWEEMILEKLHPIS